MAAITVFVNQPHRGEIAKMLVHGLARRRGLGEALLRAAEAAALQAGKTLLVLHTASADAERLYERLVWRRVGLIPATQVSPRPSATALWPEGGFVHTIVSYKDLMDGR